MPLASESAFLNPEGDDKTERNLVSATIHKPAVQYKQARGTRSLRKFIHSFSYTA